MQYNLFKINLNYRYLACGDSQRSLTYLYRFGKATISKVIKETTAAIWDALKNKCLNPPSKEEWTRIASQFSEKWDFPHCVGALDGKHVAVQAPPNSGSEFFNYKGHFSIVLMALCDANYSFTVVDIGSSGHYSDGAIFSNSCFANMDNFNFPNSSTLPGCETLFPHVIVGD